MTGLQSLKIGPRLAVGFGVLAGFMIVLALFSILRMQAIANTVAFQNEVRIEKLEQLYIAKEALARIGLAASNALAITDDAEAMRELDKMDAQQAVYLAAIERLSKQFTGDPRFARIRESVPSMASGLERVRPLRDHGKMKELGDFIAYENRPLHNDTIDIVDEILRSEQESVNNASLASRELFAASIAWIVMLNVIALVLGGLISISVTRSMLAQLGGEPEDAVGIAQEIAKGNLAIAMREKKENPGSMLSAIRAMRDNLASLVAQVREGTDTIVVASSQMAERNRDLSKRTEGQAASLRDSVQSLGALTAIVKKNADNAEQARQLALSASEVAIEGGQVVDQVVMKMNAIDAASRKIADIIGVIDSIAFQTNLLALNAAVEAARAGEQGSGFAVVANEVRNLAQRSSAAAREIKVMIDDSVNQVMAGSALVRNAGTTMKNVVTSVKHVAGIVGEISAAGQEQTVGIEQINHAVAEIDNVTQQNVAFVDESAAVAHMLQEKAASLASIVSVFQLEEGRHGETPVLAPVSA